MKIGQKLILGFLLVAVSVGFVGYMGIYSNKRVGEAFELVTKVEIPSLIAGLEITSAARQASSKAMEYSMRGEDKDKKKVMEALSKLDTHLDAFDKAESQDKSLEKVGPEHKAVRQEIADSITAYQINVNKYVALKDKGASIEELFENEKQVHQTRKELIHILYRKIDHEKEELANSLTRTKHGIENGAKIIFVFSMANIFLAFLIGYFLTRTISNPIKELANAANEIGKGNLDIKVDIDSSDEIGLLATSFNKMAEDLKTYKMDLNESITELKKHHDNLEKIVEERTSELKKEIEVRKQAEEKLASEKERLAVTLRSIGDGVITTDIEGKIVFINKVAEQLTGWSNEDAQGRPSHEVLNIINEKTGWKCAGPFQRVLETGRIIGLANHTALIGKDGTQRSIADSGAPIRDRESKIVGVIIVFRDVTNEKKMGEELLKIRKLESVGVLAGGIAP